MYDRSDTGRAPLYAIGGAGISAAQRLEALSAVPLDELLALAVKAARKSSEEGRGSPARKELGMLLVALRARSVDSDGRPDFSGKSREYRDRLTDVYSRAGIYNDERTRVSAASRQAAGDILREILPLEDLADYGLKKSGPSERVRAARQGLWVPAEVQRVVRTSPATDATADVLRLAQGALGILSRISDEAIDRLSDTQKVTLASIAGRIEDAAYELRVHVIPPDEDDA